MLRWVQNGAMNDDLSTPLYDKGRFEELMDGSPLEVFLKGHLWLERALDDFLVAACKDPKPLKLERMAFSSKVNLCEAFGLIPAAVCHSFRQINKRRNVLAHHLEGSVDVATLDELVTQSTPQVAAAYAAMVEDDSTQSATVARKLTLWFFAVLMDVGYGLLLYRYRNKYHAEHTAFAAVRIIEEKFGREPATDEEVRKRVNLPEPPDPRDVWLPPRA